ncbi:uncharacterized protein [Aristolochia californica]|uniref:uncharacterized protein n=1 Tax=Aristolochia californica TaxID=171875 RepID=UPI0035E0500D
MTRDSSQLKSLLTSPQSVISTANGSTSPITGEGSVILSNNLTLDTVLVVPSLEYNLLSDILTRKILGYGVRRGKLYYLELTENGGLKISQGESSREENSGGAEFIELEAVNDLFNQQENSRGAELETVNEFFNQPGCRDMQQESAPNREAESESLIAPEESSKLPPSAPSTEETKNVPPQDALVDTTWKKAMNEEMEALQKNATWELVSQPKGVKTIRYQ